MVKNLQHVQVPKMNLKEEGLESIDPFIYASIKRFMNEETKIAFPSMTTLVKITGMCKSAILKSIERLKDAHYINIIREFGKSKYGISNRLFKGLKDAFAVRWMKQRKLHYQFDIGEEEI